MCYTCTQENKTNKPGTHKVYEVIFNVVSITFNYLKVYLEKGKQNLSEKIQVAAWCRYIMKFAGIDADIIGHG